MHIVSGVSPHHGQATHEIEVAAATRKAMVGARHPRKRCPDARERCLHQIHSEIAISLKRSADRSRRRKSNSYRSAMSMLTFFINRGGRGLSRARKEKLEKAKDELRQLYGKA